MCICVLQFSFFFNAALHWQMFRQTNETLKSLCYTILTVPCCSSFIQWPHYTEGTRNTHGVLNMTSLRDINVQLLLLYLYIPLWVKSAFGCVHGLHWPSICESTIWLTMSREDVVLVFSIWKLGWERLRAICLLLRKHFLVLTMIQVLNIPVIFIREIFRMGWSQVEMLL